MKAQGKRSEEWEEEEEAIFVTSPNKALKLFFDCGPVRNKQHALLTLLKLPIMNYTPVHRLTYYFSKD